jgi:hypothetical protein
MNALGVPLGDIPRNAARKQEMPRRLSFNIFCAAEGKDKSILLSLRLEVYP